MKLFGYEIKRQRKPRTKREKVATPVPAMDAEVTVKTVKPATIPISQIPSIRPITLNYSQQFIYGRGQFATPEYDLAEVGKIEDTESYCRKSFEKKEGLMFKEGFGFRGPNKDTLRYIKVRFAQIARATGIPTNSLLKRLARSLIRTSNAFLIKKRDPKASGGRMRTLPNGRQLKPVAGYFPAPPETMFPEVDPDTGAIKSWRHELPDGRYKDFRTEDVIHFVVNRREGFLYGIPSIVPVIDDIRALRQIEENVELLLYQHLFPLFHYKVGTEDAPAGYTEDGDKEIDVVRDEIRFMPAEGCLVTPERHEIKAIGAEGRALNAENYLIHFKKRVFAGLGVSQVDMGDGDTTNRATAQTLSRAIIDSVKDLQDELEAQFETEVIAELLLESTFGERVLEDENFVYLRFAEIDIQNKIEEEKHLIELFKINGITWDELRNELNREPIPVPEDPHDNDHTAYPEWHNTYWKLFEEPTKIIGAIDEPWGIAAQAAVESRSLGVTPETQKTAAEGQQEIEKKKAETEAKTKIAVARITKANRPKPKKDNYLGETFAALENDLANRVEANMRATNNPNTDYLLSHARFWAAQAASQLYTQTTLELVRGFRDHTGASSQEEILLAGKAEVRERIDFYVERLAQQTISLFKRRIQGYNLSNDEGSIRLALQELHNAFESTRYRTDLIWSTEIAKAYNYGHLLGMRFLGEAGMELKAHPDGCDACHAVNGRIVHPLNADMDDVPPLHPHSRMTFKTVRST